MKYKTTINGKEESGTYKELIELIKDSKFIHLNKIEKDVRN